MKPILFSKNATAFTTNGQGRLDCVSCSVTEERNGMYELEMEIAESSNHAKQIELSSIIVAKPNHSSGLQPFRVYKITKPINGVFTVSAQHLSYQLSYIPVMPFTISASASACNSALQGLKTNSAETNPFTFSTDVTTVAGFALTEPISLRAALGGVQGSVLDQFGGEYEWDGYNVKLWSHRGVQTPTVSLRYGKNITDLNQEALISNTITGICPYWKDSEGGNLVTLTEKVVESQYADNFPFRRTVAVDMSQDFQSKPTQAQLRTQANAYLGKPGIGIPSVSIKVSFVNLADTEEYKDVAALQSVNLCDMIAIEFEKLGISTSAKVVKTVYDVLTERYSSVELGTVRSSLASTIQNTNDAISTVAQSLAQKFSQFGEGIEDDIRNATAWLTNSDGYVIAVKNNDGSWKELIFADTNDPSTWHNVLRINENGLGFSSDGGQTYKQAWTLDGKLVIGGTNVPSLTVYKSDAVNPEVLFQVSRSGIIWDVANSSMTATGVLTAKGATLTNATITGGSLRQENSGTYMLLKNGEMRGGYDGDTVVNKVDATYNVTFNNTQHHCLQLGSDHAICLCAPTFFVGNEREPSIVYLADNTNAQAATNMSVGTSTMTVVTGVTMEGGQLNVQTSTVGYVNSVTWTNKYIKHGIIMN